MSVCVGVGVVRRIVGNSTLKRRGKTERHTHTGRAAGEREQATTNSENKTGGRKRQPRTGTRTSAERRERITDPADEMARTTRAHTPHAHAVVSSGRPKPVKKKEEQQPKGQEERRRKPKLRTDTDTRRQTQTEEIARWRGEGRAGRQRARHRNKRRPRRQAD